MSVSMLVDAGLSDHEAYYLNNFVETNDVADPEEVARLEALSRMLDELARDGISRSDANELYSLVPSLGDIMPLGAFTTNASKVNLDFALEGIGDAITKTVGAILVAIFKIIELVFKAIFAPIKWLFGLGDGGGSSSSSSSGGGSGGTAAKVDKKIKALNGNPDKVKEIGDALEETITELAKGGPKSIANVPNIMGSVARLEKAYVGAIWNAHTIRDKYVEIFGKTQRASFVTQQMVKLSAVLNTTIDLWGREFAKELKALSFDEKLPDWTIPENADCTSLARFVAETKYTDLTNVTTNLANTSMDLISKDELYKDYADKIKVMSAGLTSDTIKSINPYKDVTALLDAISKDERTALGGLKQCIEDCSAPYEGDVIQKLPVALGFHKSSTKSFVQSLKDISNGACVRYDELGLSGLYGATEEHNVLELPKIIYRLSLKIDNSEADAIAKSGEVEGMQHLAATQPWYTDYQRLGKQIRSTVKGLTVWMNKHPDLSNTIGLNANSLAEWASVMDVYRDGLKARTNITTTMLKLYAREAMAHLKLFKTLTKAHNEWQKPVYELTLSLIGSNSYRLELAEQWLEVIDKLGVKATKEDKDAIYDSILNAEYGVVIYPARAIALLRDNEKAMKKWNEKLSEELSDIMRKDYEVTSQVAADFRDGKVPVSEETIQVALNTKLRYADPGAKYD